jgi:hypothetical protein
MQGHLSKDAAKFVFEMEDSVSSLLLFQLNQIKPLKAVDSEFKKLRSELTHDDLAGPRWLLAYELAKSGYTLDATQKNFVTKDARFGFLIKENVSFFDATRLSVPEGLIPPLEESESDDDDSEGEGRYQEYSIGGFWNEWDDWDK